MILWLRINVCAFCGREGVSLHMTNVVNPIIKNTNINSTLGRFVTKFEHVYPVWKVEKNYWHFWSCV